MDRRTFLSGAAATAALRATPLRAAAPLRIGFVPVMGAAPLIVFAGSRFAKTVGIDIALQKLDPQIEGLPRLGDGGLDAVATGVAPLVRARRAGAGVRIVAGLATAGSGFVATPTLARHFYAVRGEPTAAFAAFAAREHRPARLATTPAGVVPNVMLHHWLFARHAVPRDLVEIEVLDIAATPAALAAGKVDGATLPEPLSTIARTRDPTLQRITSGSDMFPDMPGVVLGAADAFAKAQPSACAALVKGIAAAAQMIRARPAEAAPLVAGALGIPPADVWLVGRALASSNLGFVTDPRAVEGPARAMLAYETTLGDFPAMPDTAGLFDDSFFRAK